MDLNIDLTMLRNSILAVVILYMFWLTGFGQGSRLGTLPMKETPVIDGHLDLSEWLIADSQTVFIQMEPHKGLPSSEKTIVYTGFDEKNLYFAFKCLDEQAAKIVSNVYTRDKLEKSDDVVFIILDTHLDRRSGYVFLVNPVGTQTDMRVVDDGRSTDTNWDTRWQAAAGLYRWGWVAEIAIPFTSISYNEYLKEFGINFGRIIRKNAEIAYWSGLMNSDFRISQGGTLHGLILPKKQKTLTITPYTTVRYESNPFIGDDNNWFNDLGGDLGYQITSDMLLNLTVNPDFATVEGDQERINLTRWELSFPEKRLFFLEGNELYSTRIRTFYSRRIGDIDYGGKIVGKSGKYTVTGMAVKTAADTIVGQPEAVFSTARIKRDILASSSIGITYAGKDWKTGNTRSLSGDYVLNLGNSWKLTGQFVMSTPGEFWESSAWFVRFARESNIYHYHIRYSDTGKNFRANANQTGFIRDDDMREIDSDLTYRWWFDQSLFRYILFESRNNVFWNHAGTLRSWYVTEYLRMYLKNNFSLDFAYNNEFKLYEKKYYNHFYQVEVGYNTDEWSSARVGYTVGQNFDRSFDLYRGELRFRLFEQLAVTYQYNQINYFPDVVGQSTRINIITIDYNFSRDLWVRLLAQNNRAIERIYFYGLFGWRFQPPFGAVYLIYTFEEISPDPFILPQRNEIAFIKFSYQIGL